MQRTIVLTAVVLGIAACGSAAPAPDLPMATDATDVADTPLPDGLTDSTPQDLTGDAPPDLPEVADGAHLSDGPPDQQADSSADIEDATGEVTEPDCPHPLFYLAGGVELTERIGADGTLQNSSLGALFWNVPSEYAHMEIDQSGDCTFYLMNPLTPECDPACDSFTEYCGKDAACHPYPDRIGAGAITVDGLGDTILLTPDESDWYTVQGAPTGNLFNPESVIDVVAEGDAVPPFAVTLPGVGDMLVDFAEPLELTDGQDNVVTWQVQGDGATVELAIQTGWHGAPPTGIIWCSAPDEAGQITIAQAIVEAFPLHGGIGLFQHPSWIRRVQRAAVAGPDATAAVTVSSTRHFGIVHE